MAGIYELAKKAGIPYKHAKKLFDAIKTELKNRGRVTVKNFGTFKVVARKARKFSSPVVGDFNVEAHDSAVWRPAQEMRMLPLTDEGNKRTSSKLSTTKKKSKDKN